MGDSKKPLDELIKEERRRYAREWRAKNKQRLSEYNRNYWAKRALMNRDNHEEKKEEESHGRQDSQNGTPR